MKVTDHAEDRVLGRVGGKKKSVDRMVEKALELGITYEESAGRLHKYLTKLYFQHNKPGTYMRVYNRKIYIYRGKTFITVLDLPRNLYDVEDNIKAKKKAVVEKLATATVEV